MITKARLALTAAAISMMAIVASPAAAATTVAYSFNTTGNTAENGTYGNAITFNTANKPSTLKMSATAWQLGPIGTISSAYLGAYGGGLGVTGIGDMNGANGLHQIDNVGLYTDFVLLEFNQAVTLASIKTNSYGIGGVTDNDAVWADMSAFTSPTWNSTAGFASSFTLPTDWGNIADPNVSGWRLTGADTVSTKWLVAAAPLPLSNRNDGFKLSSITVAEQVAAVPEPAAWAMMILGMGAIGFAMRRRQKVDTSVKFA